MLWYPPFKKNMSIGRMKISHIVQRWDAFDFQLVLYLRDDVCVCRCVHMFKFHLVYSITTRMYMVHSYRPVGCTHTHKHTVLYSLPYDAGYMMMDTYVRRDVVVWDDVRTYWGGGGA